MASDDVDPYFVLSEASDHRDDRIMSQYVYNVIDFSSQYGHDLSISYTSSNVVGSPKVYPKFGDAPQVYLMRSYGPWWTRLPSSSFVKFPTILPKHISVPSEDFIEVKFAERVLPTKLDIYETYNGGAVVKVFGYCHEEKKWETLWRGEPMNVAMSKSRVFSPPLKLVPFMTNLIRIEFYHQHLSYFTEIDSIQLHGGPPALCSPASSFFEMITNFFKFKVSNEKKEQLALETTSTCHFEKLPNEVIILILSYLDLQSLCATSQVCSWLKKLCYDPVLYRTLDLQPYWEKIDSEALECLQTRCTSYHELNVSWSGSRHRIHPKCFILFVEMSCKFLTCLKVSSCYYVNNLVLKTIAKSCQHLRVFEMRSCRNQDLSHMGFSQIACMKNLVYLDLYRTAIEKHSLSMIIKFCSNLEHLLLGCCLNVSQFNEIAKDVAKHLKNIKTLDLWRAGSLTEVGVEILAESCFELVELDIGWCFQINASNGCLRQLAKNCPKLKKVFLTALRTVTNDDLFAFASHSSELEQLDVLGMRDVTGDSIVKILDNCKKLKLLDVSLCHHIDPTVCGILMEAFP